MAQSQRNKFPGISVVLFKNVGRQRLSGTGSNALPVSTRYAKQNSVLDVSNYLGDGDVVRVHKSVREPYGRFEIELVQRVVPTADDSLYGLFEPQDMVEIRMAAQKWQYSGSNAKASPTAAKPLGNAPIASSPLPIMMRGFIDRIVKRDGVGQDGKPQRKIIVIGKDYGKIWAIDRIYFNPWMPDQANYLTQFKLFTRFGVNFETMAAGQLVQQIFQKILNPFIQSMKSKSPGAASGSSPLLPISLDIQIKGGSTSPYGGTQDWQGGSVFELLQYFADVGPWNELFIEDREDGPYVVYRPNPYIQAGGDPERASSYIQALQRAPAVTLIEQDQVITSSYERTDENVANYFWVTAPYYSLNYDFLPSALAVGGGDKSTFIITSYGNVDPNLYGLKQMMAQTMQGSPLNTTAGNGTPKDQNKRDAGEALVWIALRRQQLYLQNRDNVVFESGQMEISGNERVKAGTYLKLKHGNMVSSYYCESVTHTFAPLQSYSTMVQFHRGTGFLDRVQRGAGTDSPYLAELADTQ